MGKGPLSSVVTKDKGNATITAIKYSVPDRANLFSFYNHSQPLWVWADRTSIRPRKLNLRMDLGGRVKASIKRRRKQYKKKKKNQSLPGHAKEKFFLGKHGSLSCNYCEHHDQPQSDYQGLAFNPLSINLLFEPLAFEPNKPNWDRYNLSLYKSHTSINIIDYKCN